MKSANRILAFLMATVLLFGTVMPVSAMGFEPLQDIYSVDPQSPAQHNNPSNNFPVVPIIPSQPVIIEQGNPGTDDGEEVEPPSLGQSGEATPTDVKDEAALLAAMKAWVEGLQVTQRVGNGLISTYAAPGDTGTVSMTYINVNSYNVTAPGGMYAYGSVIGRMKINGADAFCLQIWKLADGLYTAGNVMTGNSQTAQYIANFLASGKTNNDYVAAQILIWESLYGDIGLYTQVIAGTGFQSAYNSIKNASAAPVDIVHWTSSTGGQEIATFATGTPPPPGGGDDDEEDEGLNTRTEVETLTETSTQIFSNTTYEYSDAIGQITISKRDNDGKSLDGAIFNVQVQFANGQSASSSAFEVYNGSRLFTWTHPADDHQPAKVTVTEIQAPEGYSLDPTPQVAWVAPTYTRVTKVTTHTITITTTHTTYTVIDIDSGEVLASNSASDSSQTELNPPVVQEYVDFVAGDRHISLTFINTIKAAELVIFKYRTGVGTALQGAQFEVSYVDPAVHSGRWTVTTGADGKATIALPRPGAILIRETSPPAGHIISPSGPDTTVTILAGERKQVDIPNDPYTAVEVTKVDSVTGARLAGATISLKHITSGIEFSLVTNASGIALFENVEPGSYYVEEIIAPNNYVLNTTRFPVQLRSGETASVSIPNDPYTAIEVTKIDSVTGNRLAGATFSLKHITSGIEFQQTTGANGVARFENIEPGSYYVEEIKAPDKYVLNTTRFPVQLRSGELASLTVPNDPYTAIEVIKIDSVTGARLAGATISLKHVTTGMEYRLETNSQGIVLFERIEPGSYYVEEIKAPDRYVLNPTRFPVELKTGEVASVTIPNDPYTGIEVTKIDGNNGQKLAGAFIRLSHISSGQEYSGVTNANGIVYFGLIPPGNYYVEETQAPFGYVLNTTRFPLELRTGELATLTITNFRKNGLFIRKVDENGQPLPGATFELRRGSGQVLHRETTDANGLIFREHLTTDTYVIEEIQAPIGYLMDENNPQSIFIDVADDNKQHIVTFVNIKKPSIEVVKIDADNPTKRLMGAVFRISEQGGSKTWDITTGFDGSAILENLEVGMTYIVEEIHAPSGYVNSGYREAIVLNECRVHTVTVGNNRNPGLRIEKINAANGHKLPGAVFRVAAKGSAEFRDVTTGFDGTVLIENLTPGWYVITETRAPSGFVLDSTPHEIEVKGGGTATLTVNNSQFPQLTIRKIDGKSGNVLFGAVFHVSSKGGTEYTDITTGVDGTASISLAPGWYVVTETRAPTGYVLDSTPREIEVKAGESTSITVNNSKAPTLTIRKVDAQTGAGLPGAILRISQGDVFQDVTTGAGGLVVINGMAPGTYTVTERQAPTGYLLDATPRSVQLITGQDAEVVIQNRRVPSLTIEKIDEVTKQPLQYARFRVSIKEGRTLGEFTTGEDGKIVINNIEPALYVIEETAAPDGYLILDAVREVSVSWGMDAVVQFQNQPVNPLLIKKVDARTGEPLSGARFRVTKVTGEFVGEYTTGRNGFITVTGQQPGWFTVTEVKAPDGYVLNGTPKQVELRMNAPGVVEFENERMAGLHIKKIDSQTNEPLAGARFRVTSKAGVLVGEYITDSQGSISIEGLAPGWYSVLETVAPDGYAIDGTPRDIELKWGQLATVEFLNSRLPGLQVRKVDAVTGKPLSGARFIVEKSNGERIGEYTTNNAGFFVVPNLAAGWYTAYESRSPAGYVLDSTPQNVELKLNGTAVLEFENTPLAGLQIKKVDSVTGLPLAGVEFSVSEFSGKRIGTYTTDANGLVFVPDLLAGWLIVTETKTLPGYKLDNAPRNVEIKAGVLNVVEYRNNPFPFLEIRKVDSETGRAIAGVTFKVFDRNNRELGEFKTNESGIIKLTGMEPGAYFIREVKAADGYVLDDRMREVALQWGKTTTVEVKNAPMATLRLRKVDSITGAALPGAGFILYDARNNVVGEYTTDANGLIVLPQTLPAGQYSLKEIKAPNGYVLLDKPIAITLKPGETREIEIPNDPQRGTIQITKKAAEANDITKHKAGALLPGAVFEVVNDKHEVVDTITTDARGMATTIDLPLGRYAIREIKAPDYYLLDDGVFYADVKLHDDVVRFEVENMPAEVGVTIEKRGNVEALTGDLIRYDFSNISNTGNIALDGFYWQDQLPTDAVRLETLVTGTWSERLTYRVVYRTNLKTDYRVWQSGLSSTVNHELHVSDLRLAANEFITDFRVEFGTVQPGFSEKSAPYIMTRVLDNLPHEHRFVNKTVAGGTVGRETVYNQDSWVTIVFSTPKGPLPKTGM